MTPSRKTAPMIFGLALGDMGLLTLSFFALNFWKRGSLSLSPMYVKLLMAFYGIWLVVSLVTKKYHSTSYTRYAGVLRVYGWAAVLTGYIVSLMVVLMGLPAFSRLHVFGTLMVWFAGEALCFTILFFTGGRSRRIRWQKTDTSFITGQEISFAVLIVDFLALTVSFFGVNYTKRGSFQLNPGYEQLLLVNYGLWFIVSCVTRKYDRSNIIDFFSALIACIKAIFLHTAILSVLIFAFRQFYFSRLQVYGPFLVLFCLEVIVYYLYAVFKTGQACNRDVESVEQVRHFLKQEALNLQDDPWDDGAQTHEPVREKLKNALEFFNPWLFEFIDGSVDLIKTSKANTRILSSENIFNVQAMDDHRLALFINLHRLNDIRRLNVYFLELHKKMGVGGYIVATAKTTTAYRRYILANYPRIFAEAFCATNVLCHRILPKLPVTKQVYFAMTKGRGRSLSRAEVLGRLCFCGFQIVSEQEVDDHLYVVARKMKTPSLEENPTYGPLIRLRRVGMNGNAITVYKFRTMYPYSEFLQEYIYEKNRLQDGGKLENDFRLTGWGKAMRRAWLDELPMLYNWIRGEVKLLGVRPLSRHYLGLYSPELQNLRGTVKPGLIPPFYADLPKTLNEICASEKRYLLAFQKQPVQTQWRYFWKAVSNIVFRGARSN